MNSPKLDGRRLFDLIAACGGLVVLLPLFIAIAAIVKMADPSAQVIYRGRRLGLHGAPFTIYKFRTMRPDAYTVGPQITGAHDPRVTAVGRTLRRWKLDEIPQLVNVIRGDMALVGPRPEDPEIAAQYTGTLLLEHRPGITSPASVIFRGEEAVIGVAAESVTRYLSEVLPRKLAVDAAYFGHRTFYSDLGVLRDTMAAIVGRSEGRTGAGWMSWIRRRVPWALLDSVVVVTAYCVALLLRFADDRPGALYSGASSLERSIIAIALVQIACNYGLGLHQRAWRYATAADVKGILIAVLAASVVIGVADITLPISGARRLPVGIVILGQLLVFCGLVLLRYRWKILHGMRRHRGAGLTRVLIYGAGHAGDLLARQLMSASGMQEFVVAGFVDDDPKTHGLSIHGAPVLGTREGLAGAIAALNVDLLVIASSVDGAVVQEILSSLEALPVQVRIMPSATELMNRPGAAPLMREVQIKDLLGRGAAEIDREACRRIIQNRTVLVTGAAGSIGSELCRQLAGFGPARLVMFDNNETGLFELEHELRQMAGQTELVIAVGDVVDAAGVWDVVTSNHPSVVFHAAAYKHVPLMESNPRLAFRVNVLGTKNVLVAADHAGCEQFVLVSTDKAVNPSSVMGATKRMAELLLLDQASGPGRTMLRTAVRFGNVLGSRGSVVPTFARQIEDGGPVTLTDPDMSRYFMDLGEACTLIIQAGALTSGGEVFMLRMGQEVMIADLARKMIRLRGLRPDVDIKIVTTGPRPGEKLRERLVLDSESVEATAHPLIQRVVPAPTIRHTASRSIVELIEREADRASKEWLRDILLTASGGKPSNSGVHIGNSAIRPQDKVDRTRRATQVNHGPDTLASGPT